MTAAILVEDLTRRFQVVEKQAGFLGALRAMMRPKVRWVDAVRGIRFQVDEGEMVAFIGPNGAGKSTTLKMLTGILHPTSGRAEVCGQVPWEDRQALAYSIGSVFGQRSQLWYHLPPRETFRMLAEIYEVPPAEAAARIGELVELLELEELLGVPVRKLSLGQRMRCEVAACLVHRPRVLFLDEPTIGLDVVAKRKFREFVLRLNQEERLTIVLTSHDAGDIEKLCKRTLVVNHGEIVLDEATRTLKRRWFHKKVLGLRVRTPPEGVTTPGVRILKQKGQGLKLEVDTQVVTVEEVLTKVLAHCGIEDINVSDPPLEDVIAEIYSDAGAGREAAPLEAAPADGTPADDDPPAAAG